MVVGKLGPKERLRVVVVAKKERLSPLLAYDGAKKEQSEGGKRDVESLGREYDARGKRGEVS